MGIGNAAVTALLQSPLHSLMSGSTDVVRYTGRRSGRQITTPTQYVRHGDGLLILVGHPERKSWWRNFEDSRDLEVLVRRRWLPMTARAVVGATEPDTTRPLVNAYLDEYPRAARALGGGDEARVRAAVIVWCQPR